MNKKSLGEKIRKLREECRLTQEELARKLGIPRPSVSQIESGQREVTAKELLALSRIFETSTDELLLVDNRQRKDIKLRQMGKLPPFNKEMFKQVLLYILNKCGGKPNVGKTVLYKLLYFCDFNYYEKYEEPLTGAAYRKIMHGPAPCEFEDIIAEMEKNKQIQEVPSSYYDKPQIKYLALVEPDIDRLSAGQKELIDKVIETLSDFDANKISEYSHDDVPWQATEEKEIIDYELVFYRTPAYSVRSYSED